jgi:hypothetical protein
LFGDREKEGEKQPKLKMGVLGKREEGNREKRRTDWEKEIIWRKEGEGKKGGKGGGMQIQYEATVRKPGFWKIISLNSLRDIQIWRSFRASFEYVGGNFFRHSRKYKKLF